MAFPTRYSNTMMSYDDWQDFSREQKRRALAHMEAEREKRAAYYARQRGFGVLLLTVALTALGFASAYGFAVMQGIGAVVALLAVYIMLTKQMVLIDSYYLECMDKISML